MKISNPFENLEGLARWLAYAGIVIFVAIVGAIGVIKLTSAVETRPTLASAETPPTPASAGEMKLKRLWSYGWNRWDCKNHGFICGEQYFECDYTSRTCQLGYRVGIPGVANAIVGRAFLFELLAEDRTTVIAHLLSIRESGTETWLSFDRGAGRGLHGDFTVPEDLPESCLPNCINWTAKNIPPPFNQYLQ